jgi:hypothetical protein
MTVDEQRSTMLAALRPWAMRAKQFVDRRFADASSHVERGDVDTAKERMGELGGTLIHHVAAARRHFYHASFNAHRSAGLDPAIHRLDIGPTIEGEDVAARVPILGRDYQRDVLDLVAGANAGVEDLDDPDALESWQAEHSQRMFSRVLTELSDSQIALHESVGIMLVKPELR